MKVTSQIKVRGAERVGSESSFLMYSSYKKKKNTSVLKRWPVTYWSALTDTKWCCKSRHNHDEWPTI